MPLFGDMIFTGVGGSAKPYFTYNGSYSDDTDGTTFTLASASLGIEAVDRVVAVVISCGSGYSNTISSVTINGVSATILSNDAENSDVRIAYAVVASGTSGDVVVTYSVSPFVNDCYISVYSMYGLNSSTPETTGENDGTTSTSFAITCSQDAIVLYGVGNTNTATAITLTGTLAPADIEAALSSYRRAHRGQQVNAGSVTCSATGHTGGLQDSFAASWR